MTYKTKKYACPDCKVCQWCPDTRCSQCLGDAARPRKMSIAEQIELYERINREARRKSRSRRRRENREPQAPEAGD